jgi:hypothetical protein
MNNKAFFVKTSVFFFIFPVLSACHNTEKVCREAAEVEPSLILGTWDDGFRVWEAGELLELVWGLQGGQHIWGAVQVTGLNPGDGEMVSSGGSFFSWKQTAGGGFTTEPKGNDVLTLDFELHFQDDLVSPSKPSFSAFLDGTVESATSPPQTVFVSLWDLVETYGEGETISAEMTVTATDACGVSLSESRGLQILVDGSYY